MADLNLRVKVAVEGARQLRNLGGDLSNVGRGLTIGVTAPLLAAGAGLISMARDAEKSQAKLDSVFSSMEASAWTSIEALNEHAEALQNSTTFDDEAIKEAQAVLLRFGNVTGDAFTEATEAATDLAAFWETDVDSAAQQLGKALEAPADGLARLGRAGIIFTDEQKLMVEQMVAAGDVAGAQALILAEVGSQVGNVAEDLAATSGGQMAQAMNQLGEAGESLGALLLPVLVNLAGILKGLAGWFNALSPEMKGFVVTLATVTAAVGPVLLIGGKMISLFGSLGTAFKVLSAILTANPWVALIAATIALVTFIVTNWDAIVKVILDAWEVIKDAVESAGDFIADIWDGIVDVLRDAATAIAGIGGRIWKPISRGFDAAISFIKGIWNGFVRFWNGIQISVPSVDVPFVGTFGGFTVGLPDLPFLAEGGIVTRPTLGVLGEAGPEAIIPLDKMGPTEIHYHAHLTVQGDLEARNTQEAEDALLRVSRFIPVGGQA